MTKYLKIVFIEDGTKLNTITFANENWHKKYGTGKQKLFSIGLSMENVHVAKAQTCQGIKHYIPLNLVFKNVDAGQSLFLV